MHVLPTSDGMAMQDTTTPLRLKARSHVSACGAVHTGGDPTNVPTPATSAHVKLVDAPSSGATHDAVHVSPSCAGVAQVVDTLVPRVRPVVHVTGGSAQAGAEPTNEPTPATSVQV